MTRAFETRVGGLHYFRDAWPVIWELPRPVVTNYYSHNQQFNNGRVWFKHPCSENQTKDLGSMGQWLYSSRHHHCFKFCVSVLPGFDVFPKSHSYTPRSCTHLPFSTSFALYHLLCTHSKSSTLSLPPSRLCWHVSESPWSLWCILSSIISIILPTQLLSGFLTCLPVLIRTSSLIKYRSIFLAS